MINTEILIIGAGASGLMAAKELSAKGKKVIVLEARKYAGGRINTLLPKQFSQPVEAGAEFVHGNLPVTLQLLKAFNISYTKIAGSMLRKKDSKWQESEEEIIGWDEMMQKMDVLEEDINFADFLNAFFHAEKYAQLRQSAIQFARGFDVADETNASTFALREEWQHEQDDQYRVDGGYMRLIDAMTNTCLHQHCEIHFSEVVNKITWNKNKVEVTTTNNEQFAAEKVIITVPAGILQSETITFVPAIPDKIAAVKAIGYGDVIKVLIEFEEAFWTAIKKDASFFFGEEKIAVWWTQYPAESKLLTGWIGGPNAGAMQQYSPEQIIDIALQSLDNMFSQKLPRVKAKQVFNWQKEPYSLGAYSYETTKSRQAKAILKEGIENTIYFAGEAIYTGDAPGTVEAALVSGKAVAEQLLNA